MRVCLPCVQHNALLVIDIIAEELRARPVLCAPFADVCLRAPIIPSVVRVALWLCVTDCVLLHDLLSGAVAV